MRKSATILAAFLLVMAGCGDDDSQGPSPMTGSGSSGASCPSGSTLTYDNFARAFFEQYCTRCHSSALTGAERNGAPNGYNWDTLDGVRAIAPERIDAVAAAGPNKVNTFMPLDEPRPSVAEREQLGEWLACGTP